MEENSPYDIGYNDCLPNCPYDENSTDGIEWWKGYTDGSNNS